MGLGVTGQESSASSFWPFTLSRFALVLAHCRGRLLRSFWRHADPSSAKRCARAAPSIANPGLPVRLLPGTNVTVVASRREPRPGSRSAPQLPPGQGALSLSARFGRDLPVINGGLHWRVFRVEQNAAPKLVKEEKGATPSFVLPPGAYVVNVTFGLASATKAVQLRGEAVKEIFEIPAGGLRIEGHVGNAIIPHGQIAFEIYKGANSSLATNDRSRRL